MATQVQFRGGTTTEHASFNGVAKEVTVDTTKNTLVVQDGSTNGGFPLLREKNPDNVKLHFGGNGTTDDGDLQLFHNGTRSKIQNNTGELRICSNVIQLRNYNDDGNYLSFTSDQNATFGGGVRHQFRQDPNPDNRNTAAVSGNWWKIGEIKQNGGSDAFRITLFGTSGYSSGSNVSAENVIVGRMATSNTIEGYWYTNTQGELGIQGVAWKYGDPGANKFEIWVKFGNYANYAPFVDCSADDFTVFGTNTNSSTQPAGSTLFDTTFRLTADTGVQLGYSNVTKIETLSNGAKVTGSLSVGGTTHGTPASLSNIWLGSTGHLYSETSAGTGNSVSISQNAHVDSDGSWEYIHGDKAANVYLYDGKCGFRTAAAGTAGNNITWSESLTVGNDGNTTFGGSAYLPAGEITGYGTAADPELRIYHSTYSTIKSDNLKIVDKEHGHGMITAVKDGSVGLRWDNSEHFATTATGVKITSFGSSHGLEIFKNSNSAAFLGHIGSGDEGVLSLKNGGITTVLFNGELATGTLTAPEGLSASLYLIADEGDDDGDGWRINSNQDDNDLTISNNESGSYVDKITINKGGEVGIGFQPTANGGYCQIQNNKDYDDGASTLATSGSKASLRIKSGKNTSKSLFIGGVDGNAEPYLQVGNLNVNGPDAAYDMHLNKYGGSVKLYSDGATSPKLETKSDGVRVVGTLEAYADSTSTASAGVFYNNNSAAGADCRVQIKTYANQGADPFIHFDAGGSNFIVGELWKGTTNNELLIGPGDAPSSGTTGFRINASGKVGLNSDPSNFRLKVVDTAHGPIEAYTNNGGYHGITCQSSTNATTQYYWQGIRSDGNQDGYIVSSTAGQVALTNTSDYRLKDNVVSMTNGIDIIKKLNPITYKWSASSGRDTTNTMQGFLAHEVDEAGVMNAVDGVKDAVWDTTENPVSAAVGDPKYQGLSLERLVPSLTAALKEAIAKIETLETKVAALESS